VFINEVIKEVLDASHRFLLFKEPDTFYILDSSDHFVTTRVQKALKLECHRQIRGQPYLEQRQGGQEIKPLPGTAAAMQISAPLKSAPKLGTELDPSLPSVFPALCIK
jgi:hypothetical protein